MSSSPIQSKTFKSVGESDYMALRSLAPWHPGTPVTLSVAVVAPPFLLLVVASHSDAVDEVWHHWRLPLHLSLAPRLTFVSPLNLSLNPLLSPQSHQILGPDITEDDTGLSPFI